jgi:hypothetical protein
VDADNFVGPWLVTSDGVQAFGDQFLEQLNGTREA